MKFAAVFAVVLAVAAAAPTTSWTLYDLSNAIQNPETPAYLMPYLQHALNQMMLSTFGGQPMESITIATPGGLLTVEEVSPVAVLPAEVTPEAVYEPLPLPAVVPEAVYEPLPLPAVIPEAVYEPLPLPAVIPEAVYEAQPLPAVVAPTPVPALITDAQGSPLVQIIVNIQSQSDSVAAAPAPVPAPVIDAEPEAVYEPLPLPPAVVPEAVYEPQPLPVVPETPEAVVVVPEVEAPESVIVAPLPEVETPEAVVVVPEVIPESIPIMPVTPVSPGTNPIDVIAVAAPDANPIDLLQPTPVAIAGAGEGILV